MRERERNGGASALLESTVVDLVVDRGSDKETVLSLLEDSVADSTVYPVMTDHFGHSFR